VESDTTDKNSAGTGPVTEVWGVLGTNNVIFNTHVFSVSKERFMYTNEAASDSACASSLAHEASHQNDRYTWRDGEPASEADKKTHASEEVAAAEAEIRVLKAILAGICITPQDLAGAKESLEHRLGTVEAFLAAQKEAAK
jgi:hypothetical protein